MMKHYLVFMLMLTLSKLYCQEPSCNYHNIIRYIESDATINKLVKSTFPYVIKKQKNPVTYHIADSLMFIDINFVLEGEFDPIYGIDSSAFNSNATFRNMYYHDNVELQPKIFNSTEEAYLLYLYMSKRIGDVVIIEITDDAEYPSNQIVQFGTSVIVVLLVDSNNDVLKILFKGIVHNN